jgi:hypothetical protein
VIEGSFLIKYGNEDLKAMNGMAIKLEKNVNIHIKRLVVLKVGC